MRDLQRKALPGEGIASLLALLSGNATSSPRDEVVGLDVGCEEGDDASCWNRSGVIGVDKAHMAAENAAEGAQRARIAAAHGEMLVTPCDV